MKRRAVLNNVGLAPASLRALCPDDQFDHAAVAALLVEMQAQSRSIKPEALGVIGQDHWQAYAKACGGDLSTWQYRKVVGESGGMPWIIEVAFCYTPKALRRTLITGINFSPALRNPFQSLGDAQTLYQIPLISTHEPIRVSRST